MVNTGAESLLIEGARVVTPSGLCEGSSLLLEEGRIKRIFEQASSDAPRAVKILTLNNLTLLPGFIDVHAHGAVGVDVMDATADDVHRVGLYLARNGVTGWLPTLVPAPFEEYKRAVANLEQVIKQQSARPESAAARPLALAARAVGLHYEGPFVNSQQCGALRSKYFRTFTSASDLEALPTLKAAGARHMMTVAPEIEGGVELVRELKRRGWIVAIGHTRATTEVLDRAVEAGARHMTHFFNAMPVLHHRAPGPVGWGLMRDDVTCDVVADGVHVAPLVLELLLRMKTPARVALVSDAVAPAGMGDGEYRLWNETITVKEGRTENARGNIAGSVINLSDAVRVVRSLGFTAEDVALMASLNPARLLGIDHECGTIEEGKRADLVALDDEGRVWLTIIGGRIAFGAEKDAVH